MTARAQACVNGWNSGAGLLNQGGLIAQQDRLDLFDMRHLGNGPALGQITITFVFSKPLAEVGDFEVSVGYFPDLPFRQDWRPTIPSQFHNAVYD